MQQRPDNPMKYWGKAGYGAEKMTVHLLPYHCLDVAAVGQIFFTKNKRIRTTLAHLTGLNEKHFVRCMTFFLALHDIGKFAEGFQNLRADLLKKLQNKESNKGYNLPHDTLGYILWKNCIRTYFQEVNLLPQTRKSGRRIRETGYDYWMRAITGHHGQPPKEGQQILSDYFSDEDIILTKSYIQTVINLLFEDGMVLPEINRSKLRMASWWLAGVAVLCDWIGSNADFFPYCDVSMPLDEYWQSALKRAEKAMALTELLMDTPVQEHNLQDLFAPDIKIPTPLQSKCGEMTIGKGPCLYILEDVTGAGKTEAAVLLANRLMAHNKGAGLYIALPTMATANAMFERMKGDDKQPVYQRLFPPETQPSIVLAHSARNLSQSFRQAVVPESKEPEENYGDETIPASVHCSAWLSDNLKKALLAAVGVGTIDQALLGILPSRHQCLRLFGLMDKILVIDEVHACDAYMQTLLKTLLRAQASVDGSVILLSATLSHDQRQELVDAFLEGANSDTMALQRRGNKDYPLLTCFAGRDLREINVETREEVKRYVRVELLHKTADVETVIRRAVENEQCVCWIRNTVAEARLGYESLREKYSTWHIDLFHARFALSDRLEIEKRVVGSFGKNSTGEQRKGRVVIATQVVEQSLDVDFDVMITDLAPVDLVIQRAGRLCRHTRNKLGSRTNDSDERGTPVLYVLTPQPVDEPEDRWLTDLFPQGRFVYSNHGQLWLTARLLKNKKGFQVPEDVRELTEGVFGAEAQYLIPEGLIERAYEAEGQNMANRSIAQLNALKLREGYSEGSSNRWWDEAKTPTRLGEPTTTVYLARWINNQLKPWSEGEMAWQQSAVQIRTYYVAEEAPADDGLQKAIEITKEQLPAKGKWGVLLPLIPYEGETWQGRAKNEDGDLVPVYYNRELGLMREDELSTLEEGESYESD